MNKKYAIIDIETTGGSPHREKITEIAIVIFDGFKVIDQYETLLNPERSIPPFITKLTGITNEMVREAPKFFEVAKEIVEITEDCIFVAHNVRFDYGFIQEEFSRLGYTYTRKKLCTVRMSRISFPGLKSYSLGNLIRYFNISVNERHRAMADVLATIEVFKKILEHTGSSDQKKYLFKESLKNILLPERISIADIMTLPESTGVYYFHDQNDRIIYVGKSINIRKRIRQHFQNINPKSNKLYQKAAKITYYITGSEMIAFLHESEEIKKHQPEVNKASRHKNFKYFIHHYLSIEGYHVFDFEKNTISKRKNKQILSEYVNVFAAKNALTKIKQEYNLCEKLLGLENREGPCFEFGIHQCHGACIQREEVEEYNLRAAHAAKYLDQLILGNFILIDRGKSSSQKSITVVKEGNFHGYAYFDRDFNLTNAEEILEYIPKMRSYPDQNTIIKRFLDKPGAIEIIPF